MPSSPKPDSAESPDILKQGTDWIRVTKNKRPRIPVHRQQARGTRDSITSTFALRADYVIPSKNFIVVDSGVFWPAEGDDGRYLVKDPDLGFAKDVSSDHRMVWVDLYIPSKSTNSKTEL